MKSAFLTGLFLFSILLSGQKTIFLHHSTGGGVYYGGIGLPQWFSDYNYSHGTDYEIEEFSYPNSPYPWDNYPYDYWNLWLNPGKCDNNQSGIRCLDWFAEHYDVIVFKHCFPGAAIVADIGTPQLASSRKSIENYKLQYRAFRDLMDSYPNNKFIVWTLAPLHRNATEPESASRARAFVDWVKVEWLEEDSTIHPNIFIFDFYGSAAELDPEPANGEVNCLRYNFEIDHYSSDSHPNQLANTIIMPLFGQAIVDAINDNQSASVVKEDEDPIGLRIFPNPAREFFMLDESLDFETIELMDFRGQTVQKFLTVAPEMNISALPKGHYIVIAKSNVFNKTGKLIIQ